VLIAERGRGWFQIKGGPLQELVPGKPVFAPANVPHWHGAAPNQPLVQASLNEGHGTWLGPVSDEEYVGKNK
jgi:quercetin dioxygenase-like cupin family protein